MDYQFDLLDEQQDKLRNFLALCKATCKAVKLLETL